MGDNVSVSSGRHRLITASFIRCRPKILALLAVESIWSGTGPRRHLEPAESLMQVALHQGTQCRRESSVGWLANQPTLTTGTESCSVALAAFLVLTAVCG